MPKGPQGQKRPADLIGNAVLIGRIATGEVEDTAADPTKAHHSAGGKKGGPARAAKLTAEERSAIAKKAAAKRWDR
jgi:hypothetical protein